MTTHTITLPAVELFAIRQFTAKNDIRYYLNGVCIRKGCIDATNGHYLARIELAPEVMSDQASVYTAPDIRLTNDDLDRFFKILGTSAKKLDVSVVVTFEIESERWKGSLSANGVSVQFDTPVDHFPNFEPLFSQNELLSISPMEKQPQFNWDYLALFNKAARLLTKPKANAVITPSPDYQSAVVTFLDFPRFHGLVMPLRDRDEQNKALTDRLSARRQYRDNLAQFAVK